MVEDDNTLYDGFAMMLVKIISYGQMSYRMPQ